MESKAIILQKICSSHQKERIALGLEGEAVSRVSIGSLITASVTSCHTSVVFKMAGKFLVSCLVRYVTKDVNFPNVWIHVLPPSIEAELLKNNMEIFAIRFSRKKFQKHHMRQRKVPRSVYKLAQFV